MQKRRVFKYDNVEQAVWGLQPGAFHGPAASKSSDPSGGNAFYVAKLDDRRGGNVQPFDDPAVSERHSPETDEPTVRRDLRMKELRRCLGKKCRGD